MILKFERNTEAAVCIFNTDIQYSDSGKPVVVTFRELKNT